MGASGTDVQLSQAALARFNYDVECKNRAAFAIYRDFDQSRERAEASNRKTVLVIKQNRSEPLAVITLEHFMELVKHQTNQSN